MFNEKIRFYEPTKIIENLKIESCTENVPSLMSFLGKPENKEKRELFYGVILAEGLKHINKHEYFIAPARCEPSDFELIDKNIYQKNQNLPKTEREVDHWKIQNVMITEHVLKNRIKNNENNFYKIIANHLSETKLSEKAGDYKGCMLSFYFKLNLNGLADIRILRKEIREIKQNNFEQIWIIGFSSPKFNQCFITELLKYDIALINYPIYIF